MFLNFENNKKTKELEHLMTEDANKPLIINLLENLWQVSNCPYRNLGKLNDKKVTKTIVLQNPSFTDSNKDF